MLNLLNLLSQYEILAKTAEYISSLDIFHLGLANSEFHAVILRSEPVLDRLKRTALCDGKGLKARQDFRDLYSPYYGVERWRIPEHNEELEVRVWNLKCDEANALPCSKCGINVCEVDAPNIASFMVT